MTGSFVVAAPTLVRRCSLLVEGDQGAPQWKQTALMQKHLRLDLWKRHEMFAEFVGELGARWRHKHESAEQMKQILLVFKMVCNLYDAFGLSVGTNENGKSSNRTT